MLFLVVLLLFYLLVVIKNLIRLDDGYSFVDFIRAIFWPLYLFFNKPRYVNATVLRTVKEYSPNSIVKLPVRLETGEDTYVKVNGSEVYFYRRGKKVVLKKAIRDGIVEYVLL